MLDIYMKLWNGMYCTYSKHELRRSIVLFVVVGTANRIAFGRCFIRSY